MAFEPLRVSTVKLFGRCWAFFALEGGNLVGFKDPSLWWPAVVEFGIPMEFPTFFTANPDIQELPYRINVHLEPFHSFKQATRTCNKISESQVTDQTRYPKLSDHPHKYRSMTFKKLSTQRITISINLVSQTPMALGPLCLQMLRTNSISIPKILKRR